MTTVDFLVEVLSIPTKTFREDLMIEYIKNYLKTNNISFYVKDRNIYATKGNGPHLLSVCHTDTVHDIVDRINVESFYGFNAQNEKKMALRALDDNNQPIGIGGDDKCGVFACLTLLTKIDNIKAAFFAAEEVGCIGSKNCDTTFLNDVVSIIQFDGPENYMITETCYGSYLFSRDSDWFKTVEPILLEHMPVVSYMNHPYTDVWALKKLKPEIPSINVSVGYYKYHTKQEFVIIEDVFNAVKLGINFFNKLKH